MTLRLAIIKEQRVCCRTNSLLVVHLTVSYD